MADFTHEEIEAVVKSSQKLKEANLAGIAVLMYPEGEYKNVEWALVGNNIRLKGSPSSPLFRFGFRACTKLEQSSAGA